MWTLFAALLILFVIALIGACYAQDNEIRLPWEQYDKNSPAIFNPKSGG